MTKKMAVFCGVAVASGLAVVASGQAVVGPQPGSAVLIAQYECNPADLAKVDEVMKGTAGPILSRYVAEGKLLTWGFLATTVGGPVNRSIYVWAKDTPSLVTARQSYLPEIMAKPGWAEMARMCPRQQTSLHTMVANAASTK